jgi:hypothetical protein
MYRELEEFSEKAYSAYIAIVRTWALWLQGCQIVYFQTRNINFGEFWRVLLSMEDVGIFYGHLV